MPGAAGEGRKPAGRCKNLFVFNIAQPFRFRWMVLIMSFIEWTSPTTMASASNLCQQVSMATLLPRVWVFPPGQAPTRLRRTHCVTKEDDG